MNILIVDDEPMIREWFRMTVERAEGDYRIIGEAASGEEAIAFCRAHAVDLVVTDVKMPGMNGIELIRTLKSEMPQLRSMIFSSYNEFQFAAEALKLGASEYILKAEITLRGLVDILEKMKRDLELDQRRETEINALRYRLNESELTLRSAYFRELADGSREAAALFRKKMVEFQTGLTEKQLAVMAVGLLRGGEDEAALKIKEDRLLTLAVTNIADETLMNELGGGCSIPYKPNVFLLFANTASTGLKSQRESLLLVASRVAEHLRKFVGASASIGISQTYGDPAYVPTQTAEALSALDRRLYYGERGIAWSQDAAEGVADALPSSWMNEFRDQLDAGVLASAAATFERMMDEIAASKRLPAKQAQALVLELLYAAMHRARGEKVPAERIDALYGAAHLEVLRFATFRELRAWTAEALTQTFEWIEAERPKYGEAVRGACDYVALHYAEDIQLQHIANYVHLSRTYFSELFKKETGLTFNEYVMRVRMEKAKEALKLGGAKVSDVAAGVGYANPSYFIKLFKKYAGCSPYEFMEAHQRALQEPLR